MSDRISDRSWKALRDHHAKIRDVHLRQLFADDPRRGERLTVEGVGLYLDYSKHRVTDETLRLLVQLAEQAGLRERIDAMFRGEKINVTENRAVLHVALRAPRGQSILVDGKDVVPEVHAVLDRMAEFATAPGRWLEGHTGKRSGPSSTSGSAGRTWGRHGLRGAAALQRSRHDLPLRLERPWHRLRRGDARLDPAETLFIVSSKTFTTLETMTNARSARGRCGRSTSARGREALRRATNAAEVAKLASTRPTCWLLGLGRRPLLDGPAIGLSTMIAIGPALGPCLPASTP
jgi:glucose-6-phosphate isomerase